MIKDNYFQKYLKIAPFSHALWRSVEAETIAQGYKEAILLQKKKTNDSLLHFKKPVLDVGCGYGEFAGIFFESQVEAGIDISINDLIKAKRSKKYKKLFVTDARHMSFRNNTFSTVICMSVIEHIPKPELVLKEIYRVLKPCGYFILTVPTSSLNDHLFYPQIFRKAGFNNMANWYINKFHRVFKHVNIFSRKRWVSMTAKKGFKVIIVKQTFPKSLVAFFDFFLISALPSQIGRWLFGVRAVWGGRIKYHVLNVLYRYIIKDKNITDSNILIIAQKK